MNAIKLTILGVLIAATPVFAQTPDSIPLTKPHQWKSRANYALMEGDVYTAIDYYEKYVKAMPTRWKEAHQLAELYRLSRDYVEAGKLYKACYEAQGTKYPKALYWYGVMLQHQGRYKEAGEAFAKYKKEGKASMDRSTKKQLKVDMISCEIAPALMDSDTQRNLDHLGNSVNKPHIELAPVFLDESTMLYASMRVEGLKYFDLEQPEAFPTRQFYTAKQGADGYWKSQGRWDHPANLLGENIGNGVFSADGERFYFTRCETDVKNRTVCGLFFCERKGARWSDPEPIPGGVNMDKYTSTMPAVGVDPKSGNEVLFFVSDRPGGKGGMDIWYTIYDVKRKTFKSAKNAGSKINTVSDEMTPYYDLQNNALYFSSAGHPGLGGLDVFQANGELKNFEEPVNVGAPINSCADDLYFVWLPSKETGFIVSNRLGGLALKNPTCCDDIYQFSKVLPPRKFSIAGKLMALSSGADGALFNRDQMGQMPGMPGATVHLYHIDKATGDTLAHHTTTTDQQGYYIFPVDPDNDYHLRVEEEGYLAQSAFMSIEAEPAKDTLQVRPMGLLAVSKEPIRLPNINYATNSADLTPEAIATLDTTLYQLLVENPDLSIEISAHSDSRGSSNYNRALSEKRAASVKKYLVQKGISEARLTSIGYGEDQLLQKDIREDGSFDEEAGQLNRRTVFRILGGA